MKETSAELKERLFCESDAMIRYIAGRGIDRELLEVSLLRLLDKSCEERKSVAMNEVFALHQNLSRIVSPAFPETIHELQKYRNLSKKSSGFWSRIWLGIAPLNSVKWLIATTVVLVFLLAILLSSWFPFKAPENIEWPGKTGVAVATSSTSPGMAEPEGGKVGPYFEPVIAYLQSECRLSVSELAEAGKIDLKAPNYPEYLKIVQDFEEHCQNKRRPILLRIFFFFGLLGTLGAAYSSIYDSFSYIREGRYDLRLASTYYVRILLGGFSGILLAEPLSDFLEQGVLSSALLAFIGGFSAQLVYDLLSKLVDSVANMFRADRRREQQIILAQAEFNARGIVQEEDAAKRHTLAQLLAEAQDEPDPAKRAKLMEKALLEMMSGKMGVQPVKESAAGLLLGDAKSMLALSELSSHVASRLPDAPVNAAAANVSMHKSLVEAVQQLVASGSPQAISAVRTNLEKARKSDLISPSIASAVSALSTALKTQACKDVSKAALAVARLMKREQIARWRHVAYGATNPELMLVSDLLPEDLKADLRVFSRAGLAETELFDLIVSADEEELFKKVSAGFDDRESFDTAISDWLNSTVDRVLAADLESLVVLKIFSKLTGAELVGELKEIARKEQVRGGLQLLEIVGSGVPLCEEPDEVLEQLLKMAETLADLEVTE